MKFILGVKKARFSVKGSLFSEKKFEIFAMHMFSTIGHYTK